MLTSTERSRKRRAKARGARDIIWQCPKCKYRYTVLAGDPSPTEVAHRCGPHPQKFNHLKIVA